MTIETDTPVRSIRTTCFQSLVALMLWSATLWLAPHVHATTLLGEVFRASDSSPRNAYGYSISISGDTAAIGAWFGEGAVYILELDPDSGAWLETDKIETPDIAAGEANFGFSVALDGDQLVVGAPNILLSSPGAVAGFAFIYQRNASDSTWQLVNSVEGQAAGPDDFPPQGLGREVVVDQGLAAISRDDGGTEVLLTYAQDQLTGDWVQTEILSFDETNSNVVDIVGTDVSALSLDDERLAVGVETEDSNGLSGFEILLFDYNRELGGWIESNRLDESSGLSDVGIYRGLAMDDNQLLVARDEGETPLLFLYDLETDQWSRDDNFSSDFLSVTSTRGFVLDIEGSRVVLEDANAGAVVYERNAETGRWVETLQLSTALVGEETPTVTIVDLEGDHILMGVPYIDDFTGAVVAYRLDDLDSDGVIAVDDNCPADFNPTQENFDGDLLGDICDADDDNDGVDDNNDGFPLDPDRADAPAHPESGEAPMAPQPAWPIGNGILLETDFRWPAVSSATYYVIEVQHNGSIRAYEPNVSASTACINNQCLYIKSDAARNGANRWRLRAGNDAGVSQWSPWVDFFVGRPIGSGGDTDNLAAFDEIPSVPSPQLPFGNSSLSVTEYVWSAVPGVIDYAIEVQHDRLIRAYEPFIAASEVCSSGQCAYTKSDAALIGTNRWRVRATNAVGSSDWSDWVDFGVSRAADDPTAPSDTFIPATPVPDSPVDEVSVQVVDYRWSEVTGATFYAVEVQNMGSIRGYTSNLLSSEACSTAGCIYSKPDAALQGENRWRVRSGNSNGFSAWSDWQLFEITGSE